MWKTSLLSTNDINIAYILLYPKLYWEFEMKRNGAEQKYLTGMEGEVIDIDRKKSSTSYKV